VTITVTDKAGKAVRTFRGRGEAGVNRYLWDLRYDMPGGNQPPPGPDPFGDMPAAVRERFGGGPQGPAVNPGDYVVKVKAGDRELTGTVTVRLDPGVQAAASDLDAQLTGAFDALALQARVNTLIERVESLIAQLTALDAQLGRQTPPPPYRAQVTQALAKVKAFRDDTVVRPLAGLGYRQYPRLREDVQSLVGYFNRGFRAPNDGELERLKDLTADVGKAEATFNGAIAGDIAAINDAMKGLPRIALQPIK
jgi:hypothetical protein